MKLVLHVYHDGQYKMVGKLFPHPVDGKLILLHEESGGQGHRNLSAPGGIDQEIVPFLQDLKHVELHHYNRKEKVLYTSGLYNFLAHGQRQKSGGRNRIYLHERYWHKHYQLSQLPYDVPWIKDVRQFGGPLEGTQLGLPGLV